MIDGEQGNVHIMYYFDVILFNMEVLFNAACQTTFSIFEDETFFQHLRVNTLNSPIPFNFHFPQFFAHTLNINIFVAIW